MKTKLKSIVSIATLIFTTLMTISGFSQTFTQGPKEFGMNLGLSIFFLIVSILLLWYILKKKHEEKLYTAYVDYLSAIEKISLQDLSSYLNRPISLVKKEISHLISQQVISGFINEYNEIIMKKSTKSKEEIAFNVVHCNHCGAPNKVSIGRVNTCAYCNSLLPSLNPSSHI
ncbi:MAG: hypothetical protein ACLTEH_04785 [Clostridia bacterium]